MPRLAPYYIKLRSIVIAAISGHKTTLLTKTTFRKYNPRTV